MGPGPGMGRGAMGEGMCAMGSGPLTEQAVQAAVRALTDERRAEQQYADVLGQFGRTRPFMPIEMAERRHAAAIERFLTAHGEAVPEATESPAATRYPDVASACNAGAQSERVNIAMYDELLAAELPDDERCVFEHLRAASRDRHLPAFEHCAR